MSKQRYKKWAGLMVLSGVLGSALAQPVNRLRIGLIGRFALGVKDLQTELRAAQTAARDSAPWGSAHTPRTLHPSRPRT